MSATHRAELMARIRRAAEVGLISAADRDLRLDQVARAGSEADLARYARDLDPWDPAPEREPARAHEVVAPATPRGEAEMPTPDQMYQVVAKVAAGVNRFRSRFHRVLRMVLLAVFVVMLVLFVWGQVVRPGGAWSRGEQPQVQPQETLRVSTVPGDAG